MSRKDEFIKKKIAKEILEPLKKKIFAEVKKREFSSEMKDSFLEKQFESVEDESFKESEFSEKFLKYYTKRKSEVEGDYKKLINRIKYLEFMMRWEDESNNVFRSREIQKEIYKCENEIKDLENEDPIAFYTIKSILWSNEREGLKKGNLVHTPTVTKALKDIISALRNGEAVFLRGHLGSGKTELAVEATKAFSLEYELDSKIRERLNQWANTPDWNREEQENYFIQVLEEELKKLQEKEEEFRPYFIAGNKDIRATDLFVEKILSLEGALSDKNILDALREEDEEILRLTNSLELDDIELSDLKDYSSEVRNLYRLKHGSFGTTVKKVPREVLLSVTEGKALVIDELNGISMEHLIGLNDLLQKKPGENVYITGVGSVNIKKGFGLVSTGNLSSSSVIYGGTDELNPAFASRFYGFEYSYLPQSIEGILESQEKPENNELFRVVLSLLAREDGSLFIPGGIQGVKRVFALCQYARATQDIFSGRYKSSVEFFSDGLEPELSSSVLSLRSLRRIIDDWSLGLKKDLDQALWDGFLRSVTVDDDLNLLINLSLMFGFFPKSGGWSVPKRGAGEAVVTWEEMRDSNESFSPVEPEVLTVFECLKYLYGEGPSFEKLPDFMEEYLEGEKISPEEFLEIEEEVSQMEESAIIARVIDEEGNSNGK